MERKQEILCWNKNYNKLSDYNYNANNYKILFEIYAYFLN